jgi:hydroxymethylpyrimidine kinase/phosphomethylpyrimidine kinase
MSHSNLDKILEHSQEENCLRAKYGNLMPNPTDFFPTVLCIGGLDPSGGAGITADARACAAFGAHALCVATAIVAQNTRGVKSIEPIASHVLQIQIETLLEDMTPSAIKIGMLPDTESVKALSNLLQNWPNEVPIVIDTVFAPSSGPTFNDSDTVAFMADHLLPLATLVTPNAIEARQLGAASISSSEEMQRAAVAVFERPRAGSVLLKGGHVADPQFSTDLFFDGTNFLELRAPRINGYEVRGTGCLLASAIAAQLGQGVSAPKATQEAKMWLTDRYLTAKRIGNGRRVSF